MGKQNRISHRQDGQSPFFLFLLASVVRSVPLVLPCFTLSDLCSSFDDIEARKDAGQPIHLKLFAIVNPYGKVCTHSKVQRPIGDRQKPETG